MKQKIRIERVISNKKIEEINNQELELLKLIKFNKAIAQQLFSYRQIENSNYYINALSIIIRIKEKDGVIVRSEVVKQSKKSGYKYITIRRKKYYVHRLVANAFLELDLSINADQVNHLDKNRANNNLFNLEIVTNRENRLHSVAFDSIIKQVQENHIDILSYSYDVSSIQSISEFINATDKKVLMYHYQ